MSSTIDIAKTYVSQEGITKYDELIKAKIAEDISDAEFRIQEILDGIQNGETISDFADAEGAIDAVDQKVNGKVSSVTAVDASITISGEATAPTVAVKLSEAEGNALTLAEDGLKVIVEEVSIPEYSIVKNTNPGNYAAVYRLTKDGEPVGDAINILKDMVVESGEVITYDEDQPNGPTAGTYIKLKLQNVEDSLHINVGDLIEYVTSGSENTDMVVINIDGTTHEVTATVTDKSLTLAKMATDVTKAITDAQQAGAQASADLNAYQETNDIAMTNKVETSVYSAYVESNDQAVAGLSEDIAAFTPVTAAHIYGLFGKTPPPPSEA